MMCKLRIVSNIAYILIKISLLLMNCEFDGPASCVFVFFA